MISKIPSSHFTEQLNIEPVRVKDNHYFARLSTQIWFTEQLNIEPVRVKDNQYFARLSTQIWFGCNKRMNKNVVKGHVKKNRDVTKLRCLKPHNFTAFRTHHAVILHCKLNSRRMSYLCNIIGTTLWPLSSSILGKYQKFKHIFF